MAQVETIFALATAPLAAGVAVVRLSGPQAWQAAGKLCKGFEGKAKPREAFLGVLKNAQGEQLDQALLLGFKAPASFTGEDVVELHLHGGQAVIESVQQALLATGLVRPAQAGEFTRCAVENGKMDLTAAEGIADLVAAQTAAQQQQALRQLQGELGNLFEAWRQQIMHLLAQVEAGVDFPDEELDILEDERVKQGLQGLVQAFDGALVTQAGERLRSGFELAIIGKPNAGKSTLTNLLTGQDTAIVSDIAGTTRDVVTAALDVQGYPVTIADTAGLRQSEDVIEQEGVRRATSRAAQADAVIAVVHANDWPQLDEQVQQALKPGASLVIVSHTDVQTQDVPNAIDVAGESYPVLGLNLQSAESLAPVLAALGDILEQQFGVAREAAQLTRQRHRDCVQRARSYIAQGLDMLNTPQQHVSVSDKLAQDLRDAARAIGEVTGKTGSEDVLDLVFSTFCIGK